MTSAIKIISELARKKHPFGKGISKDEAPSLVNQLIGRLKTTAIVLNLTPVSLKRLENLLAEYYFCLKEKGQYLDEEQTAELIRELAAYVGEVLIRNTDSEWKNLGTLWNTEIVFKGDFKVGKEGKLINASKVIVSLGNIAADAWDMIVLGKKPGLYRVYKIARSKKDEENLS